MNIPKGAIILDIETNGLLPDLDRVHCIAWKVYGSDTIYSCGGESSHPLDWMYALDNLANAPMLIGHNIIDFDLPALQKVFPTFRPKGIVRDTMVMTRLIWPDVKVQDYATNRKYPGKIPGKLINSHKLEAWGHRIGSPKAKYEGGWDQWTPEMEDYCKQDVVVNAKLFDLIASKDYSEQAIQLEHDFYRCICLQEHAGFPFDVVGAQRLYTEWAAERAALEVKLKELFPPWEETKTFTPKVNNKKRGYVKGVPFVKRWTVEFNPRSHQHIGQRLIAQRGWVPKKFTDTGDPAVDETVLNDLRAQWPECELLAHHMELNKLIGMLAEGDKGWLKLERNGRLYGHVITNGTVTGRCAHRDPNLGQIPRRSKLGALCRGLFTAIKGFKLVGADASGLELRMLAHYMARWDDGQYVKIVTTGDVHTENMQAAGLTNRDDAKTFIYAFLYGAGFTKLGTIVKGGAAAGKKLKQAFLAKFPALRYLINSVQEAAQNRGYLLGLDKRRVMTRSVYSALNTLLQSAGALVMKQATVFFHEALAQAGYLKGAEDAIFGSLFLLDRLHERDVYMVAHVHDEFQSLVREGLEDEVGKLAVQSIKRAGEHFGLRCPLDGEYKVGENWKETH